MWEIIEVLACIYVVDAFAGYLFGVRPSDLLRALAGRLPLLPSERKRLRELEAQLAKPGPCAKPGLVGKDEDDTR